jgi:hypothetical protein
MLRQRKFVIHEKPGSSPKLVNIQVNSSNPNLKRTVSQSEKFEYNPINQHIQHLPYKERIDVFKNLREEGYILDQIRRKKAMSKFEHIYLDRDAVVQVIFSNFILSN